jgi:outer membrane PBP1 activator LpoA protein
MAFLALDFARARLVRPYLGALALYATSQLHPGAAGALAVHDLAGVHFVDMPWLLQPDHPAVMIYPRADFRDELDLERLYALGIDAFRVAQALLEGRTALMLDGVTGQLALGPDRHVARELTRAQFRDGRLAVIGAAPP